MSTQTDETESRTSRRRAGRWVIISFGMLALILVPFVLFEEPLLRWSGKLLKDPSRSGVGLAVALLLALDVLLPIPSSMVSTASGALLGFAGGTVVSTIGMTAGCLVGYLLGKGIGAGATRRVVGDAEVERVRRLWERNGAWTLVILRAVPVLAEASVVFAGIAKMPPARFLLLTAATNACISSVYSAAGAFSLGSRAFFVAFAAAILVPLAATLLARTRQGT